MCWNWSGSEYGIPHYFCIDGHLRFQKIMHSGLTTAKRIFSKHIPGTSRHLLTKSSVVGPLEPPLSLKTLPEFFNTEVLPNFSARPALICRQEKRRAHGGPSSRNLDVQSHLAWDYEEFDRHIGALARGLIGMGVKPGDRVGVITGNNRCVAHPWPRPSVSCSAALMLCFNGHARVLEQFL